MPMVIEYFGTSSKVSKNRLLACRVSDRGDLLDIVCDFLRSNDPILDVQKNRHVAEIILFCANHITIDASSETEDMYKSIDETIDKIARRMRKHKTRLLKKHRPRPEDTIKHLDEKVFSASFLDNLDAAFSALARAGINPVSPIDLYDHLDEE